MALEGGMTIEDVIEKAFDREGVAVADAAAVKAEAKADFLRGNTSIYRAVKAAIAKATKGV